MDIGYITEIGNVRKENQDRFVVLQKEEKGRTATLCAVADGMGGTEKGSLASEYVTEQLYRWGQKEMAGLLKGQEVLGGLSAGLENLLLHCHEEINAEAGRKNISTGTTLSLLCAYEGWILVKHAGDSRIYMRRQGQWSQLTRDHTWEQFEITQGRSPQADSDYRRKRGKLVNAIGAGGGCWLDTQIVQTAQGDRYFLCTDGVYRYMDPLTELDGQDSGGAQALAEAVALRIRKTAAADNFTAVYVCPDDSHDRRR